MSLLLVILGLSSVGSGVSFLIVEVDVDRLPRGFLRGPKWVSLNSVIYQFSHVESQGCCHVLLVRFHDMISSLKVGKEDVPRMCFSKCWFCEKVFREGNNR